MAFIESRSSSLKRSLTVAGKVYHYFSFSAFEEKRGVDISKLPYSKKILFENLLRFHDERTVFQKDIDACVEGKQDHEIAYRPTRVLMQDFTGVPAVVDLAAMRDAVGKIGGSPQQVNPLASVDLVIDHSITIERFGYSAALQDNVDIEFQKNHERYSFLRWGQDVFDNFRVVPPGVGICHQVNLEFLAKIVWSKKSGEETLIFPDTVVGTDSHTTMVNGLGVLGWGVGGIEAEAVMLGQPVSMLIPEVVGFYLTGELGEGITATDLVLRITEMLRKKGVVGKFVEYYGPGLENLTLADRATIANMAPEYGATCGIFPIDQETLNYLYLTGRPQELISLVEEYAKVQGLWRCDEKEGVAFDQYIELDISTVKCSVAGPKRPQDRIDLENVVDSFEKITRETKKTKVEKVDYSIDHGDVVIAAITSCTNTSNPFVLLAAGLLAKKAVERGLKVKPWVKTSLAPGSQVVENYLEKADLLQYLEKLGFFIAGFGCTTCIGNSGPLEDNLIKAIEESDLIVAAVLSGNRNFEGRISPHVKANYLLSPPLVVAYAIAGSVKIDLTKDPLGQDESGRDVYLKDIWPSSKEVKNIEKHNVMRDMYIENYQDVFLGSTQWRGIATSKGETYSWDAQSTYVQNPPYFHGMTKEVSCDIQDVLDAKILVILGDSVTTDHISPAGSIKLDSPAGEYLLDHGVEVNDFNSYGARRGNHEVMMRGTFANIRLRNEMLENKEGGYTIHYPSEQEMSIYDASMKYQRENKNLVIIAGKEYGTGSSRDWAAKGTKLLGVKAVIAESFERIHRSNLVGMGVLPLQFQQGEGRVKLKLVGRENLSILGIQEGLLPGKIFKLRVEDYGEVREFSLLCRIDTLDEVEYYKNGGILNYVLRNLAAST